MKGRIIMKKFVSVFLILITVFTLFSCSKKYEPVKSTDKEAEVICTLGSGKNKEEVKYELYRTFFLNYKDSVAGGDAQAFTGENKDANIAAINEMIFDKIATIYATLSYAKTLGIDPYSKSFDEKVTEYVRVSVEGNGQFQGHGGDYDAYLNSLKEENMNYAVSELIFRYELTLQAIDKYYRGQTDPILGTVDGALEISDETLREYYFGEESVRVIHILYAGGVKTDEQLQSIRAELDSMRTSEAIGLYILNNSIVTESDIFVEGKLSGIMIGKHVLSSDYYSEYINAAFSMKDGEVSEVIKSKDRSENSYIIHKLEKTEEHFKAYKDTVRSSYIDNLIGKSINSIKSDLLSDINFTDAYSEVVHSNISME